MSFGTLLLILIIGIVGYFIYIYNNLVSLRQGVQSAWSDIDVQLKRRYNLIPALVDTVKGYKEYEASTLEKVVKARQMGMSANSVKEHEVADNILSQALGKLFALSEAYPDLKANSNFLNLQEQLGEIEDSIQNSRRYYNAIVRDYNTAIESFPDVLIAKKFNFTTKEFFELDEAEREDVKKMPKIDFN